MRIFFRHPPRKYICVREHSKRRPNSAWSNENHEIQRISSANILRIHFQDPTIAFIEYTAQSGWESLNLWSPLLTHTRVASGKAKCKLKPSMFSGLIRKKLGIILQVELMCPQDIPHDFQLDQSAQAEFCIARAKLAPIRSC